MLSWLASNLATITIALILAAVVGLIVVHMYREKKKGKSGCGCNCATCGVCTHKFGEAEDKNATDNK